MFIHLLTGIGLYHHEPYGFRTGGVCIAAISFGTPPNYRQNLKRLMDYILYHDQSLKYDLVFVNTGSEEQEEMNINLSLEFPFDKRLLFRSSLLDNFDLLAKTTYEHAAEACGDSSNTFFFGDYRLKDDLPENILSKAISKLNSAPSDVHCLYLRDLINQILWFHSRLIIITN